MKSFAYRETPEQAGSAIRHQITKNIEKLTKERNAVTKPLYQELKEYKPGINPIKAQTFIENELKDATGMTKKSLLKIKEMIKPEPEKINLQGLPPKAIEQIREQGGGAGLPSALKLKNAIEEISDMIGTANKNNARKRANKLREVKDSLLEDLINTPQSKADLAYSKLSEPISEITRNKRLDKAGKKDIYNKSYITESDASAKTIIGRAMKSDEFSDNFLKQFGDHPQTMKSVHGYINDDLITNVMDKNGRINLNELHSWKLSNPNANKLYPNFDKKIHDLQKKGLIDKLNEHLEGDKNITYDKMDKYMKNNRAMLNETFDENQLKVLEGSRQALAARHRVSTTGRGPGSPTASNLTILQSIEQNVPSYLLQKAASGSLTGKAGIWIYKFFQNAKKSKANELLDAALRDKDVAELLLTHVKDGKKAESIITRIKKSPEKIFNEVRNRKSLISPIMGSKKKEEED
jgi:hypothetical protein